MEAILALAVLCWFLRVRRRIADSSSSCESWDVLVSDPDSDDVAVEIRSSKQVGLSWQSESELAMSDIGNGTVKDQKLVRATVKIMGFSICDE